MSERKRDAYTKEECVPFSFPSEYTETFPGSWCAPSFKQMTVTGSQCFANSSIQRWKNPRFESFASTTCVTISGLPRLFSIDTFKQVQIFARIAQELHIFLLHAR